MISVVMPVYNAAKFLDRSIPSVLAQSYSDFEFVILDDASSDNSWEIIQKYAKEDIRIKAYSISFVDGPKVARDSAIRRASGDWIIAIDADDTIEVDYVERLWKRHLETDAEFVGSKMVLVDEMGNRMNCTIPNSQFDYSVVYSGTEAMLRILSYWQFGAGGVLWKRSVMTNVCPEGTYYDYADEYDTRVYLNNCKKVAFVDTEYYYTQNTTSCTHKVTVHSLTYLLFNYIKLKEYFDKRYGVNCALSEYYLDKVLNQYERNFFALTKFCVKNRVVLSEDMLILLTRAYSYYRQRYTDGHYWKVLYVRFLWMVLRRFSNKKTIGG